MLRGVMPDQDLHVLAFELAVLTRTMKRRSVNPQFRTDLLVKMFLAHVPDEQVEVDECVGAEWTTQGSLIGLRLFLRGRGRGQVGRGCATIAALR